MFRRRGQKPDQTEGESAEPTVELPPRRLIDRLRRRRGPDAAAAAATDAAPTGEGPSAKGRSLGAFGSGLDDTEIELVSNSVLLVGRKKTAVGLLWQVRNPDLSIREQGAQASAGTRNLDVYATHAGGRQLGLGAGDDGLKHGMRAAALSFDPAVMGETWLAAFPVASGSVSRPTGWWIVAHREALVYEDQVFFEETEARAAFTESFDAPGWERIICPEDWSLPGTEEVSLGAAIAPKVKGGALRPFNPLVIWLPRLGLVALLGVGAFGLWYAWTWYQDQMRIAEEQMRRTQEAARRAALESQPWQDTPPLPDFVRGCAAEMQRVTVHATGWTIEPFVCEMVRGGASLSTSWKADGGGYAVFMRAAARHLEMPDIVISPGGEEATLRRQMTLPVVENPRTVLPLPPAAMEARIVSRFQTLGLDLSLRPRLSRLTPQQAAEQVQPVYNYHELTVKTDAALEEYVRLLSDFPALVPAKLTYDMGNEEWELVARIYHPPIGGQR